MEDLYFDIQVEMGVTKHARGLDATKQLAELCKLGRRMKVLVVGCGNGVSATKIAEMYGSIVVATDISGKMIKLSKEMAKDSDVSFMHSDIHKLPFKNGEFDVVLSESVTAFGENKLKALKEFKRVMKKGGLLGMNEMTWLSEPTEKMDEFATNFGGMNPETESSWRELLKKAGLSIDFAESYKMHPCRQLYEEIRLNGVGLFLLAMLRLFKIYLFKAQYRKALNKMIWNAFKMPRGFSRSLGYGMYIAKKL